MCHSSKGSKFFLGALLGGAIGAVAGLLLAPVSGKESRRKIKEVIQDKDTPQNTLSTIKQKIESLTHCLDRKGSKLGYEDDSEIAV